MPHQKLRGKFQAPLKSSSKDPREALPVHIHSVSWLSLAVLLPPPTPGHSSPDLTLASSSTKQFAHSPQLGGTLFPPLWAPKGLREGQGAEAPRPPCSAPAAQGKSSRSPASGTSVWETSALPPLFAEGWIVYPSGCSLALCYKILSFSFLLFSSAVFFFPPGFISRDGLWRYG